MGAVLGQSHRNETIREVIIVRVEKIGMTSARLIQCPRMTAKFPTEVVKAVGSGRLVQFT